jgi:hypothetical protein
MIRIQDYTKGLHKSSKKQKAVEAVGWVRNLDSKLWGETEIERFGNGKCKKTGSNRKLMSSHNYELYNANTPLFISSNNIRLIKFREIRCVSHVASIAKMKEDAVET